MHRTPFWITRALALTLMLVLLRGLPCFATPDPVRIGLLLPPDEADAAGVRQGVELAVDHASLHGEQPVGLIIRGRVGQWGDDGMEAARMVLDDGVHGLVAPPDGAASHLTLQVAGRTAAPVISLCGDSSVTAAGIPWSVRIVPSTTDEAAALFSGLGSFRGARTWLAFVPDQRSGREATHDLNIAARSVGVDLVRTIEVARTISDYSTLYPTLPLDWPDGILLWLDPEPAGHMAKYLRTVGFKGLLAGPSRLEAAAFRTTAGSAMEGMFSTVVESEGRLECAAAEFDRSYRERHGQSPDSMAAMAYDAARLLINLLRQAGDDPPHELFPLGRMMSGVTGPLNFDRDGNRLVSLRLVSYRRGDLVPLTP